MPSVDLGGGSGAWLVGPTGVSLALGLLAACPLREEPPREEPPREEPPREEPPREAPAVEISDDAPPALAPLASATVAPNPSQDVLSTRLELDVSTLHGRAEVTFGAMPSERRTLEVGGLRIEAVVMGGKPVDHELRDGRLEVRVPQVAGPVTLIIDYGFESAPGLDGYMADRGTTLLWPTACDNLFPCVTTPADGMTFELALRGVPRGLRAIYPPSIPTASPSYMVAFAIGDYQYRALGSTTAGTRVGLHFLGPDEDEAMRGTEHLSAAFDWLERTYGPYAFGDEVASVQVSWPPEGYAGMEHHPFWHVETGSIGDARTHVHEAVHGWFGNGVRIRCWEDLVLSEGVTSYLTERALEAVGGPTAWARVEARHEVSAALEHEAAWPVGCTRDEPLLSSAVYVEGALFMRAVEQQVGRPKLDAALADFYQRRVGTDATMGELVEAIEARTDADLGLLVELWLR